jgi:hypothetical protein
MEKLVLSTTNVYMIIYGIICLLFTVAFFSQPYLTFSNDKINANMYYTNSELNIYLGKAIDFDVIMQKKSKLINKINNDTFVILILSIIIFIFFGCSFLTLFLHAKKLNKLFNILILLIMISIIILFHVSIYAKINISDLKEFLKVAFKENDITITTTESTGYALTMTSTVLMFVTVVSSFFFNH